MIIMLNDELDLWYLLSDCVDELRDAVILSHTDRQVSEFMALTARQLQLLRVVCRLTRNNAEGISLKRLAEELKLSSSAVSLMVEALVQKDELERLQCSRDRRMVLIRLSPRGRVAINGVRDKLRRAMKDYIADMSESEQSRTVEMLERLLTRIRSYSRQFKTAHPADQRIRPDDTPQRQKSRI